MTKNKIEREDSRQPKSHSFIVPMWASIFRVLSWISLFSLLRQIIPWMRAERRCSAVVEAWVLTHTILALCVALFSSTHPSSTFLTILLVYGAFRIFEIVVTQTNVLLFDEWRAKRDGRQCPLRSYRRTILLLLHNYTEVVFWFVAALLALNYRSWLLLDDASLIATSRMTLLSMFSFSTEGVQPLGRPAVVFVTIQSLVGIFMTLLILARFLSLMPTPATQEPTER